MNLGGMPYWNKTFHKDSLWTLSNAFLMTIKLTARGGWSALQLLTDVLIIKIN